MYYLKCFILYSLLGFIMESVVYKVSGSNDHSGVLLGPYTFVYGIGGLLTVIINNCFSQLELNIWLRYFLLFIIFTIVCTLTEYLIGNLIHFIFDIDKWNYTNHKYHFGKYICLDYAFIWGILALSVIYFLKPFFDKVLALCSNNATWFITIVMLLDLFYTLAMKMKIR